MKDSFNFNEYSSYHGDDASNGYKKLKKRVQIKSIIIPTVMLITGYIAGILTANYTVNKNLNTENVIPHNSQKKVDSLTITNQPTPNPTPTSIKKPRDFTNLIADLESYTKSTKGTYGIYVENLVGGENFGIRETQTFTAASTIKVPLNYMLYKRAEEGKINLDSKITYKSVDFEVGTGILQKNTKIGTTFTLRRLSELSITMSDNIATNMIFRGLGGKTFCKTYFKQMGGTSIDISKNISSPKDMGLYLNLVYQFSQSNATLGGELINNMQNTQYKVVIYPKAKCECFTFV